MSLHIGRLSPDVRQPYLEHLFQAFGGCTVNLKDGYGFAVYDANGNAAQALRALHGKFVCGKRITVNWSKQQPRSSQSSRRSSRFIEPSNGRISRDGVDKFRYRDSAGQKSHPASCDQSHNPDDAAEEKSDEIAEDLKDAGENIGADPEEMKTEEGGVSDANAIEHDRWGENAEGNPDGDGDGDDFDRYEPYHGYAKQEETEKASNHNFRDHRRSSGKWQEHPVERFDLNHDKSRSLPTCYICGTAGHIGRNCPQETDWKFKARRDGLSLKEERELKLRRFGSPMKRRPEFYGHSMVQTHQRVQDNRKLFSDRNGRAPWLSNVSRPNRRHTPHSETMPEVPKEAHTENMSKRSRGPSLSSDRTSLHSKSRSSRSHSRAYSPSHSAHSSSKSSQPTQSEGLKLKSRSNISYPDPLSVSVSPQYDSPPASLDAVMKSPLEGSLDVKASSAYRHTDDHDQEVKHSRLKCEVPVTSSKLVSNGTLPAPGKVAKVADHAETNLDQDMVDNDDIVGNGVVSRKQEKMVKNGRKNSLKLSTNEVVSALKHYGMEARETELLNQPAEKYFGAARLWPWEIIYYRRRKKGPITTENYAKRLEQNKEFGIVDQYVRSSSGWWESH